MSSIIEHGDKTIQCPFCLYLQPFDTTYHRSLIRQHSYRKHKFDKLTTISSSKQLTKKIKHDTKTKYNKHVKRISRKKATIGQSAIQSAISKVPKKRCNQPYKNSFGKLVLCKVFVCSSDQCCRHFKKGISYAESICTYPSKHLEYKLSTVAQNAGFGVFAHTEFSPGDYITEYAGTFMTMEQMADLTLADKLYTVQIEGHVKVGINTPKFGEGMGSFINAGIGKQPVNSKFVYNRNSNKIYTVALTYIGCGSELLVRYGKSFWNTYKQFKNNNKT